MVDWKKVGKQALDLSKQATEKGVDSFQEWKNDPERIQKNKEKPRQKKLRTRLHFFIQVYIVQSVEALMLSLCKIIEKDSLLEKPLEVQF